jgi:hypothetical protein
MLRVRIKVRPSASTVPNRNADKRGDSKSSGLWSVTKVPVVLTSVCARADLSRGFIH